MEINIYRRLWPYIRRYLHLTVMALLATMVVSATSALIAWLIQPVLDDLLIKKDGTLLNMLLLAVLGVFVVKAVFTYFQSYLIQRASHFVVRDIRNNLYHHVSYFPLSEMHNTSTGVLISKIMTDVGLLSQMGSSLVKGLLQQTFTIIGLLIVVFIRDWKLALISVTVLPMGAFFVSKFGKRVRSVTRKARESIGNLTNILQESLTGMRIIKTFVTENKEIGKFRAMNEEVTGLMIKHAKVTSRVSPSLEVVSGIAIVAVMYYGVGRVIAGGLTTGEFFSFVAGMGMLYQPVKTLGNLNNNLQASLAAAERIFGLMNIRNEEPLMESSGRQFAGVEKLIEYRNVSYTYSPDEDNVLNDINLTIRKGEVVALVGASGGGKSTMANLLPRFYDVEQGGIFIDGTNIREFGLRDLRGHISVVTQDTILFNDTVRSNIEYVEGDYTEDQVREAAKAAYADRFIQKLPEGYDTIIGEKGARLSGGEKQRISIARAILKDSPILILDEATSSLDTESERMVQGALENLMKNRTTLVIAHRLSTIINADRIVVMDRGRITDVGRHAELIESSAIYKKLYNMQFAAPVTEYEKAD